MNASKLHLCQQHFDSMSAQEKDTKTGKHFRALLVLAGHYKAKAHSLEMEAQEMRIELYEQDNDDD